MQNWVWHMGWLRFGDSLKLYISFAEYSLFFIGLFCKRDLEFSDWHLCICLYICRPHMKKNMYICRPHTEKKIYIHICRPHQNNMSDICTCVCKSADLTWKKICVSADLIWKKICISADLICIFADLIWKKYVYLQTSYGKKYIYICRPHQKNMYICRPHMTDPICRALASHCRQDARSRGSWLTWVFASRRRSVRHDSFVCVWHDTTHGIVRHDYGVATISRLLKFIGLFCKRAL